MNCLSFGISLYACVAQKILGGGKRWLSDCANNLVIETCTTCNILLLFFKCNASMCYVGYLICCSVILSFCVSLFVFGDRCLGNGAGDRFESLHDDRAASPLLWKCL